MNVLQVAASCRVFTFQLLKRGGIRWIDEYESSFDTFLLLLLHHHWLTTVSLRDISVYSPTITLFSSTIIYFRRKCFILASCLFVVLQDELRINDMSPTKSLISEISIEKIAHSTQFQEQPSCLNF